MSQDTETSRSTETSPTKPDPSPPPRWLYILPLVNLALLVASIGLISYLLYDQHKLSKSEQPIKDTAEQAKKADEQLKPDVEKLKTRVQDLAKTMEERPAPPNYAPQFKAIDDRISDLGKSLADLTDRYNTLNKQLAAVGSGETLATSPKFEAVEKRIAEVSGTVEALKAEVSALTTPSALAMDAFGQSVKLFKEGKWAEAKDAFTRLQAIMGDDARVWYFSALANGLATRDWKGESDRLAAEGMARERAGKPEKAKIDAAFADLTTATGKDWLAYYRSRASGSPDTR